MPELPELDVMQEVLAERIIGRTIVAATAFHPGILKTVDPGLDSLVGKSISGISRRGKHLVFSVADDLHVVVHLMMSGRLILCRSNTKATKASGFLITFDDGEDLRLIENTKTHRDVPAIAAMGIEPLSDDFTLDYFQTYVQGRRRQLKKLLIDQTMIAGIGTAYADEILRLHESIRSILLWALDEVRAEAGGATLTPHKREFLRIYKKTEEPCPECGTKIAEIRYAQTKTYYCPTCQSQGAVIRDRRSWLTR